jgi:hypothetical protein
MEDSSEILKKIEDVFGDTDDSKEYLKGSHFELEDFSEQELKEIKQALNVIEKRKGKTIWKWHFWGRIILKGLLYLFEFFLLNLFVAFALYFSINNVTLLQVLGISSLLSYFRFWWK